MSSYVNITHKEESKIDKKKISRFYPDVTIRGQHIISNSLPEIFLPRNVKKLHSVLNFLEHDFNESCGIEWSLNSCFIDSVLFALFSLQDTFDSWLLKEFEENNPERHKTIVRSQTMLRKIVNYLRHRGYVNSDLIYQWRCYLYNKCDIEIAFKHRLKNDHPFYLLSVDSNEKPQIMHMNQSYLDLKQNKNLSTDIVLEPNYRIDFTTAKISNDVPPKIYFELYPRNKKHKIYLTHDFEAEFADATEFLQAMMELFGCNSLIKTKSIITTSEGEVFRDDNHGILFLGVPDDSDGFTLQELMNREYLNSKAFFYDKKGVRRSNTTTITSFEGNGLLLALKRMQPDQKDKARNIPVFVETYLEINDDIFELMSIICQHQNHYHTFARHPYDKNRWYYHNDKSKKMRGGDTWKPTVVPLSTGFGFLGFSQISESEKKLVSMITTSAYLFSFRKK